MSEKAKTLDELVEEEMLKHCAEAWERLLGTEDGRLILWSILDLCGLQNFAFNGNAADTLMKGRQQIGAELLVNYVYPLGQGVYCKMLLEAEARDKRLQLAIDHVDKKLNEERDHE